MFRITNENLRPTEWGRRALWMSVLFPFTLMAVGGVYDVLPCESVNKANLARVAECPIGRHAKRLSPCVTFPRGVHIDSRRDK